MPTTTANRANRKLCLRDFFRFLIRSRETISAKSPMMLLKSLNYAIDSILKEKRASRPTLAQLFTSMWTWKLPKNCSKWNIFRSIVFSRIYGDGIMCPRLCERKRKCNSSGWTKLFLETIVSRSNRRNFYSHCPQLEGRKKYFFNARTKFFLPTWTFKSRCK